MRETIIRNVRERIFTHFDEEHVVSCIHSRTAIDASFREIADRMNERQKQNA